MDIFEIIITLVVTGFGFNFALLYIIWVNISHRFDKSDMRIDKLDEKITDIDRRVCRMEGAMTNKDCCMLKDQKQLKKAE